MAKQILFITTHNLATNPRLVKEMELALQNNFAVSVICFEFNNWSRQLNEELKNKFGSKINYTGIPGNRKPLWPWLMSSLLFILSKWVLIFLPQSKFWLSVRCNKRSWLLMQALKKMSGNYQLLLAHNAGSFYPALQFATKHNIPLGIDLEDYHPGESKQERINNFFKQLNRAILPKATFITAASPDILEHSEKDLGVALKNKRVVLNYFPSTEFELSVANNSAGLSLVWFSQNISFGRGLEQLIPVIKNNPSIALHLFGHCNAHFKNQWLNDAENIHVHHPLPQVQLHRRLSQFDVGLAIEPGKDLNNELALSNKMLAYFQSGTFILASNTPAQSRFLNLFPEHGLVSGLQTPELKQAMETLLQQKESIRALAKQRFEKARLHNWEIESQSLLELWKGHSN
ncbi:MAG: hypothetical protein KF825_12885 [Ferruginibacter sp.]|nr:hypothetical protein [Ferruginibacter sp.]